MKPRVANSPPALPITTMSRTARGAEVKEYPFLAVLKNGDAMKEVASALTSANGQIYLARIMALLHEARKAREIQLADGGQTDGESGGATEPLAVDRGSDATAPVNGAGPRILSEHIASSTDDEGSLG